MNSQIVPKHTISRKFTHQDIEFIAARVARGNTESEAVLALHLQPKAWFTFKNRAKRNAKFMDILTRLKGEYINSNLEQIDKAASGRDGVRHDWRAADRLNSIMAPERFSQQQQVATNTNNTITIVQCGGEAAAQKLIEQSYKLVAEQLRLAQAGAQGQLPPVDKAVDV